MNNVDYLKLSEQYASFLVAIGGVSITVLALILTFYTSEKIVVEGNLGSYLVLALVAATVCCFIGAHMMAETAAFISYNKERLGKEATARDRQQQSAESMPPDATPPDAMLLGKRLFVLASINVFLAVILLLFALMLLPSAFKLFSSGGVRLISFIIFLFVTAGALFWLVLGALYRLDVNDSQRAIYGSLVIGSIFFLILIILCRSENESSLWLTFIPIILSTVFTLAYFTWIFKDGNNAVPNISRADVWIFSLTIAVSYAALAAAAVRTMFGT